MKHFNFSKIISSFVFLGAVFFLVPLVADAQVSNTPLFISNVYSMDAYPYYQPAIVGNGTPGICVLASFGASEPTIVQIQHAPFSSIANPTWSSPLGAGVPVSQGSGSGVNVVFGNSLSSATEYIVRFVERAADGTPHIITPDNLTDEVLTMCTPNSNGTLAANCPVGDFVVTECTATGVNEAMQNANANGPSASISNVTSTENSLTFSIATNGIAAGENLSVVYSTDASVFSTGNLQQVSALSLTVPSSPATLSTTITNLQNGTTYYVSILNSSNIVIIDTASNQPYEVLTVGSANTTTGSGTPATINVNLSGTFGTAELAGENIEQGFTQCGYGEEYDCDFNQALATIDRIIKFLLYLVILPLAAILFAWAGIKLIVARAQGKSAAMGEAKALFGRVIIGLILALGAWVLVKFILVIFGYTDASGAISSILGITTTP